MKKKSLIIILLIIFFGGFFRFYQIDRTQLGFYKDEAALGFNAWAILKTGADEYGQKLPIFFRSFEVFFMPAYLYLSLPFFLAFGNTELATRFLSALAGILLISTVFLIAKELFKSEKAGFISALLTAISPWAIFYSRGAFEGNLALFFFSLGFYFWIKFFRTRERKLFFVSLILFILSMYSYQSPRLVVPLIILFSVLSTKKWLHDLRLWIMGAAFVLLLYLPVLEKTFSPSSYFRAARVSVFTRKTSLPGYSQKLGKWQYFYLVPREFISLYLHYFSPNNLFSQSDSNPQRRIPNFSVFYLWQFPLLLIGIWRFKQNDFPAKNFFLFWLFLAPLPAALTGDPFHTYRSLLLFLPLTLLMAFGFEYILGILKKKKLLMIPVLILIIYSVGLLTFNYFKMMPIVSWRDWDYGYREIVQEVKKMPEELRVIIDDPNTASYIHLLFYGLVPIKDYQKEAAEIVSDQYYTSGEVLRPEKIGRFEFRQVDWPNERGDKNTLFIFSSNRLFPSEFTGDPKLKLVKTINSPGGDPAFYLIKTQ